jgi:alpha-beta hydrolase superfamily lysophospholipase
LRYEKRTAACRIEGTLNINEEVTDDALAAAELLRDENLVSDGDVIVAGHSLGGALAPRIATEDRGLAGLAMLAAPARPLTEVHRRPVRVPREPRRDGDGDGGGTPR